MLREKEFKMSVLTKISPAAVVAPVYELEQNSDLSMPLFLDQITLLLNNDFFAPIITQDLWDSKALTGTNLEQVRLYLSDSACTFKDVTGEIKTGTVVTSQMLIAINNTLAPLLDNKFSDLPQSNSAVKVNVKNHINSFVSKVIPDHLGVFSEMSSDVTFAMPIHNPVAAFGKSQSTLMHLNLTFTVASDVNLESGHVVLKTHQDNKPVWDFEIIDGHFTMALKSEHSFENKGFPNIHPNITPLFFGLRHMGDIENRIHNSVALRILKNQDDFAKLLAQFLVK